MKKTIIITNPKDKKSANVEVIYEFSVYGEDFVVHGAPHTTCTHLKTGISVTTTEEVETKAFYVSYLKAITNEKDFKKAIKVAKKKTDPQLTLF